MAKRKLTDEQRFVQWAKANLRGLTQSNILVGIMDDKPDSPARYEFMLHIGHCVMTNKPIIIPKPRGTTLPSKLAAIADVVVEYDPGDLASLERAVKQALIQFDPEHIKH